MANASELFSPADAARHVANLERLAKTQRQQVRRAMMKADTALADWYSALGSPLDLLDYEKHAERAQLCAGTLAGTEALIRSAQR